MKIRWFGHACFEIVTLDVKIVTDPFNQKLGYPVLPQEADVVTVSHDHWDHNATEVLLNHPVILRTSGQAEVGSIKFSGIPSFHDKREGQDRGANLIFKIQSEGITLVHLGDLGHVPAKDQIDAIGKVDVLLIPVGGIFTIDAQEAVETVNLLKPHIVIPMHYDTADLSFSLDPVENFTVHYDCVIKKAHFEIAAEDLAGKQRIVLLDHLSC